MRVMHPKRVAAAVSGILLPALVAACGTDPVSPELIGFYSMSSLDGATLPAELPCTNDLALHSMLVLDGDWSASFTFAIEQQSGDTLFFEGNGTFRENGTRVDVMLEGAWTGSQPEVATFRFDRVEQSLRRTLGRACDAAAEAVYLPALVALESRDP